MKQGCLFGSNSKLFSVFIRIVFLYTLKIKVLHDAIEEPFCLNGFIKNLQHLKKLSDSQKVICGERRFFRLLKGKKEMVL